jgi:DNA polymerase-3 subunit beta
MKFSSPKSDIANYLSFVSRAVSTRPLLPIMGNIFLSSDLETQTLTLKAYDGTLAIQSEFPAQVSRSGNFTLPARLLNDITAKLPDADVCMDLEPNSEQVSITCGSARYRLQGMSAEEFPELPKVSSAAHRTVLPVSAVIEGLRSTMFAASTDETKNVLTGIHLSAHDQHLEFAATDGHRLAILQVPLTDGEEVPSVQVTPPTRALRELEKMLAKQTEEAIAVQFDHIQMIFELARQTLTTRLLDGNYPNYRQLLPKQFERQITLDRKAFIAALERVAVLADNQTHLVKLQIDSLKQEIVLTAEAYSATGQDSLPAQIIGDSIQIAFNERYLQEGIKAMTTTEVQMQINTPVSPVVFTPVGGPKMTYLIMPVQIRS